MGPAATGDDDAIVALDGLEWQMTKLRGELETAAHYMDEGAAILAELAFMKLLYISIVAGLSRCNLAG